MDELVAFDNALATAGIADLNLIKVSSIVPQGARLVPLREFPIGSLVPTVYTRIESDTPGETIAAAVALGLSPDGRGVIMEYATRGPATEAEAVARARVEAAFAARGIPLHECHVVSAEHTVQKHGCAVAAAILWGDELEERLEEWETEAWTPDVRFSVRVRERIFSQRSPYQHIEIVDTFAFGRMLWLDDTVQTSEGDQWAYHEMLVHVPMFTHPNPRRVLIIGGGDGGALHTVLHHPIEEVTMVEIDRDVIRACREYLPSVSAGAFDDPRVRLVYKDAFTFLDEDHDPFDVMILDIPDPIGPAMRLFTPEFYRKVYANLRSPGVVATQSGSPWLQPDVVIRAVNAMRAHFSQVRVYLGHVPTYPAGLWSFAMAARGYRTEVPSEEELAERFQRLALKTRYYTPEIHRAAFVLPPFIQELLD
jgi:spermidine synthase